MTYEQAKKVLTANNQAHVLAFWPELNAAERKVLLAQIATIDFKELKRCADLLAHRGEVPVKKGIPKAPKVQVFRGLEQCKAVEAGENELAAGRVAALVVAGGQGSRLGFDGPKGAYPIGPISNESLFYFHARKVLSLQYRYDLPIPLYVMTSAANYAATVEHFKENNWFGLEKKDVIFFRQGMWPGMTDDGKIILENKGKIFMSPDGHGGLLTALSKSGCFKDMHKRGIQTLFFFQVDNPLVEVCDRTFVGAHVLAKSQYSLKLCAKRSPTEGLGMVVTRNGHHEMIEYTEMTDEMNNRRTKKGELYFKYGSPAIHIFDVAFLEAEAKKNMPLHLAHKKIPFVDEKGNVVKPTEANGWKFEKFIFDCLPDAQNVMCMAFDRAEEFSPVKNAVGSDSPETCKRDLQAKWRRGLKGFGVILSEDSTVEVDPVGIFL